LPGTERQVEVFEQGIRNGRSVIHRFDPRLRLVVAALFAVVVAVSSRWAALSLGLLFSLALVLSVRLSMKGVLKRLAVVNGLILFLWVLLPFSTAGRPLLYVGPLVATEEGVRYAALLTVRCNVILLGLIGLLSTNSLFTLGRAMGEIRVPDKLVQLLFFTYRYLHVIQQEYEQLIRALKIRGFRASTGMHTYKTYAYLIGMLLVKSYDRSVRVRNAMLCRGFRGRFYNMTEFRIRGSDVYILLFMLLAIAAMGLIQWTSILC
jgi:cobalt/nickel transport system permease protein